MHVAQFIHCQMTHSHLLITDSVPAQPGRRDDAMAQSAGEAGTDSTITADDFVRGSRRMVGFSIRFLYLIGMCA